MAEFPKLAIKGKEEFKDYRMSLLTKFVGIKSAGDNTTKDQVKGRFDYANFQLGLDNELTKGCEKAIEKGVEINVQKIVAKLAKSQMKNKEDNLAV